MSGWRRCFPVDVAVAILCWEPVVGLLLFRARHDRLGVDGL